jgi:hypothetical protein
MKNASNKLHPSQYDAGKTRYDADVIPSSLFICCFLTLTEPQRFGHNLIRLA